MFSSYEKNHDPHRAVTFGDGNQGLVKGLGKIAISPDHSISNIFLVDSLDYNLLSVSQLCKMGYNCLFTDSLDYNLLSVPPNHNPCPPSLVPALHTQQYPICFCGVRLGDASFYHSTQNNLHLQT
jgi:hypothetical protein